MNLDTRWLEDFLTLADIKHFSKAAAARHITQPAFGRRIKALEAALGQTLFDRTTTPITLTPAGRQFRSVARNIIDQMQLGMAQLDQLSNPNQQPIRFASPHSLSSPTLIDLLDEIDDPQNPSPYSVDVMRMDEGIEALREGSCDFLLGFESMTLLQPPFLNIRLGSGQFLLVSKADQQGYPLYSLSDEKLPFQAYSSESYSARLIEQYQPQLTTPCYTVFESSMCQLHKEMVLRGKGVAWLPDSLIRQDLRDKRLVALDSQYLRIPFQVRLYRNNATLSKQAEALWQTLLLRTNDGWTFISPSSTDAESLTSL